MDWLTSTGAAAAAILAIATLLAVGWRKVLRPIARLDSALPVLLDIAEQFKPNGGATLYDQMQEIKRDLSWVKSRLAEER